MIAIEFVCSDAIEFVCSDRTIVGFPGKSNVVVRMRDDLNSFLYSHKFVGTFILPQFQICRFMFSTPTLITKKHGTVKPYST